ncbi:MAG TPA: FtsX-like permease family protein [Candidatus Saccharimonadales bacterium]|nr:FtsX-like permease family protein [Candidatus Saccharimonadales bacterium]
MNVFNRGIRNAFRNGIRSAAILGMLGLSIGLSLAMLLAHQAIGQKINSVQDDVGNTITIAPAGIRGFDGGGTPLTTNQVNQIKATANVTSVDATLTDRLTSDNTSLQSAITPGSFGGRQFRINSGSGQGGDVQLNSDGQTPDFRSFKLPVTVTGASNPLTAIRGSSGSSLHLTSGQSFDGTKDADVALLGSDLATKNSLRVGGSFTAYGANFTVAGIFDAGNTFSNDQVIMPLPTVQRLSNQSGDITGATATIDSAVNLDSTTAAISKQLGSAADVTNDATLAKATVSSLQNIQNVSLFSLIGAAGTAAVILLLTMVMIVRERRREIGVLKAIGGSNLRVMGQFVVESLTLTVLAALIGVVIGALAATPVTKLLANNSSMAPTSQMGNFGPSLARGGGAGPMLRGGGFRARFENNSVTQGAKNLRANVNGSIVLYGLGSALVIAAVGSTAAAGLISRVRPSEVMRTE